MVSADHSQFISKEVAMTTTHTCAICRHAITDDQQYVTMLLGEQRSTVHTMCATDYRRRARELLQLLDEGNALLGLQPGGA